MPAPAQTALQQPVGVEPGGAAPVAGGVEGVSGDVVRRSHRDLAEAETGARRRAEQGVHDVLGESGHHERDEPGDAALGDQLAADQVTAEEHAVGGRPEPLQQGRGEARRPRLVGGGVRTRLGGDPGQRVLGDDQQSVDTGVLDREGMPARHVRVTAVAVVGGEPHIASVVQVGRTFRGLPVVKVGAAVRTGGGRLDTSQRAVPAGAVVHAGLPRVHHGRQPAAAEVAGAREVVVPGHEPVVHTGQETAAARGLRVRPVDEPGRERVHRGLHDAGGLGACRGACRGAVRGGAPEVGAGEVRVEGHGGAEHDVGDAPVGPLRAQQALQLTLGPAHGQMAQTDRDEGRVPAPLVRIQPARRDGGGPRPVGEEYPCRAAPKGQVIGGGGHGGFEQRRHAPDLRRNAGTERTAASGSPVSRHSAAR